MPLFFRYARARAQREDEELAYRAYMTETVRQALQGKALATSYLDLIQSGGKKKDTRSGDEIAADVIRRAGLTVV